MPLREPRPGPLALAVRAPSAAGGAETSVARRGPVARRAFEVLLAAALAAGCTRTTPEAQLIEAALRALGGRAAVEATRTLVIEGEGEEVGLGQSRSPDAGPLTFRITGLKRAVDFANARWRQELTFTPLFPAQDPAPQQETTALDGRVAFDVGADGSATRATDAVARDRRAELWRSPVGTLRAAIAPGALVSNRRRVAGHDVVDVRTAEGEAFTLTVDGATGLPLKVASMTDQPNLGDVSVETEFAGYQPAGPLKLPTLVTTRLGRDDTGTLRVSKATVNAPTGDLAAPAPVRAASAAEPPPALTTEELAPGVWRVAGRSHHGVLVEFADHLTLIEAARGDAHALAVFAKARELRPSKPLTQVVNTHHHFDHSGGVRAAVSEGLTVIAHERSRRFLEELVARPHTIAPDALARRPRPLSLQTVAAQLTLEDPTRTLHLYAAETGHADTMLVAYLPRERLLVEADLYTPPPPKSPPLRFPHVAALLDVVKARGLDVERVVPLHRHVVPFAELVAAAQQAPAPTAP